VRDVLNRVRVTARTCVKLCCIKSRSYVKMSSVYSDLTVVQLKERLRELNQPTNGSKAELTARLLEVDPYGECVNRGEDRRVEDVLAASDNVSRIYDAAENESEQMSRQMDLMRKEKELAERELQIAQREINLLRQMQQLNISQPDIHRVSGATSELASTPKMNITAIADLLSNFDGNTNTFDRWEKQVRMLQRTYKLQEDTCRILIGLRLKGKALAWFHSRPENIAMPVEELLADLRGMFFRKPNRVAARKEFEARVWKKNEKFSEYLHEKIILANQVPVSEDELVDYLIDGIPDSVLRDQARIQRFADKSDLLEAFEKVTLRGNLETKSTPHGNSGNSKEKASFKDRKTEAKKETEVTAGSRRCHSCGASDHLFAKCPTKNKGVKCFECREYGHYASQCPKKSSEVKDSCDVSHFTTRKYYKEIKVDGQISVALIDTGSDLSLMRADQYVKLGLPKLKSKEIKFCGIGSEENKTLGEFCSDVEIDGSHYNITFHVVSDTLTKHNIIIGTDFLDSVSVLIEGHKNISIRELQRVRERTGSFCYKLHTRS